MCHRSRCVLKRERVNIPQSAYIRQTVPDSEPGAVIDQYQEVVVKERDSKPVLFALEASRDFGARVASLLGLELASQEDRHFEDGEHKTRPVLPVRNRDTYILHSLFGDDQFSVHDKLCRLLFFVATLRDAGASSVTVLMPYLAYGRKDRRSKPNDPVTTRYVAQLLEAMGADRVVALEAHNQAAFDNAFRCRTEHLEAHGLFVSELTTLVDSAPVVIVSPDSGGTKRVDRFRDAWAAETGSQPPTAFLEKHRSEGVVSGDAVIGDLEGRVAIIVDDMVAGGTTLLRAAQSCKAKGATKVYGVVTHGLFGPGSERLYSAPELDLLLVSDSVKPMQTPPTGSRVKVVSVASLFAGAIGRHPFWTNAAGGQ